jgi:hypothetical protein
VQVDELEAPEFMKAPLTAYLTTLAALLGIDFIWLSLANERLYRPIHSGTVTRTEFGRSQFGSPSFASRRGGGSPPALQGLFPPSDGLHLMSVITDRAAECLAHGAKRNIR